MLSKTNFCTNNSLGTIKGISINLYYSYYILKIVVIEIDNYKIINYVLAVTRDFALKYFIILMFIKKLFCYDNSFLSQIHTTISMHKIT